MPIRVPGVDDHASFRSLARRLLVDEGFEVIGEASDGGGAAQAVVELRPGPRAAAVPAGRLGGTRHRR